MIIIGAGFSGLTCAYFLIESKKRILVLERGILDNGDKLYATCQASVYLDQKFWRNDKIDSGSKILVSHALNQALQNLTRINKEIASNCSMRVAQAYAFNDVHLPPVNYEKEVAQLKAAKIQCELVEKIPQNLRLAHGQAIQFSQQIQFNSRRYLYDLTEYLRHQGVNALENQKVEKIRKTKQHFEVWVGKQVYTADKVLFATTFPPHYEFKDCAFKLSKTYVKIGTCEDPKVLDTLLWNTNAVGKNYLSPGFDKAGNPVILIGGNDQLITGSSAQIDEKGFSELSNYISAHLVKFDQLLQYSSPFIRPLEDFPWIGECPLVKNAYVSVGFYGDGIIYGTLAGEMNAANILGKPLPSASIFTPKLGNHNVRLNNFIEFEKEE